MQDAEGCVASSTGTVQEPTLVNVNVIDTNATCSDSNGVIVINATGGPSELNGITGAYVYSIDGGNTFFNSNTFTGLPSGTYGIVVRDTNYTYNDSTYCSGQDNVDLGSNSDVTTTMSSTNESCFGVADGTATVTATSAAGGFTYVWSQTPPGSTIGGNNRTVTGLSGNVFDVDGNATLDTNFYYIVTVTDADGCTAVDTAYIIQPDSIQVLASALQDVSCHDGNDGSVMATPIGRDRDAVTYAWNNGGVNDTLTNLSTMGADSMAYIVVITDSAGCTATDTVFINQPVDRITGDMSGSTVSCTDSTNGVITINSLSGGTPFNSADGYLFSMALNGLYGPSSVLSDGYGAGVYTVYVQDANGCIDSIENIVIRDTVDYEVTAYMDQTIDLGDSVTLYGAVNSTDIDSSLVTWTSLDPSSGITNLIATGPQALQGITVDSIYNDMIYILALNNGCGDTSQVYIEVNKIQTVYVPNAFSPNGDGNNDVFTIYGSKDVRSIKSLTIFDCWGELVHESGNFPPSSTDLNHGWDGTLNGKPMNPGVFVYYAEVELVDGTVVVRKGDLTLVK